MLASTWMDMVVGVDIHFEMVPTPAGPIPTPFPNPFIGMVFDPAGLAVGLAIGAAMALATGGTPTGPVLINCMPATNVGTEAKGMGHILIPPGAAWVPMPKFPKPSFRGPPEFPGLPVKPEDDAVSIMGSTTVTIMGTSGVRMGELWMSCGEPLRMPSSTVIAIPKGPLVLVGGPPGVNLLDALLAMIKTKWVAGYLHSLLSRIKSDRIRNIFSKVVCFFTGHPVDVASGRLLTDHVDFELPGPLPLKFERSYASSWSHRDGPLGPGWSHSLDQAVWFERGKAVYLAPDGREIEFDTFDLPDHVIRPGQDVYDPINQLTLRFVTSDVIHIETHDGETREFRAPKLRTGSARDHWWRLQKCKSRDRHEIVLNYDQRGNLSWVRDSGGRVIQFEHDALGRLVCVRLPHPTQDGFIEYVRYAYDSEGDLVQVIDVHGASWAFAYNRHLMVRETNRNGLSFYFAYDGWGADAYCVRTWGDDGIYDHVIDYSKGKLTVVTNSLGHQTAYKLNEIGLVVEVVDARGSSTKYVYDERLLKRTQVTDPTGGITKNEYDGRGNLIHVVQADGSELSVEYDAHNQPVRAVDVVKGTWQWAYDTLGRIVGSANPAGERSQYFWNDIGLAQLTDAAGQQAQFVYDSAGNLIRYVAANGASTSFTYDRLGRRVSSTDAKGNVRSAAVGLDGRTLRVDGPEGVREFTYDPEGNVRRVRGPTEDVAFEYRGMNRIAARSQAGTRVEFLYDTEERLIGIKNEHGIPYRFKLGAVGDVLEEYGFGELRRQYFRDPMGRVTVLNRPGNKITKFTYDKMSRVIAITHSDGTKETYEYRADGLLTVAENQSAKVVFERDALGRVIRELQGNDWVSSSYDRLGRRIQLNSSRGLAQSVRRNSVGDVTMLRAGMESAGKSPRATGNSQEAAFGAEFDRDSFGLEIERRLPGGLRARWERDSLGRPVRTEVWSNGRFQGARQYNWGATEQLSMVVDAMTGPIHHSYDALGNLVSSVHATGKIDLRMPDAVGNLFRTVERADRTFGRAGELLEAWDVGGTTRYEYDAEGNLIRKVGADGKVWSYTWNCAGMLTHVTRPDGDVVHFAYDALARRISKRFRGKTTHWIWDGDVVLHEWSERVQELTARSAAPGLERENAAPRGQNALSALLASRPANGPPATSEVTPHEPEALITWLFEPDRFAPLGKLVGDEKFGIIVDDLGTPISMFNSRGAEVWGADTDAYGELINIRGDRSACPFRWPGQYEDEETGLYYNRFRYYAPEAGQYISQDPIGLLGSLSPYKYVANPTRETDPFGLTAEELAQSMSDAGRPLSPGQTAHHIVKENGSHAAHSRALLDRNGIDVNSSPNGAALWGTHPNQVAQPGHPGRAAARAAGNYHGGVHIHGKANDKLIYRILRAAEKRGVPIEDVLEDIGRRMESGTWQQTAQGGCY